MREAAGREGPSTAVCDGMDQIRSRAPSPSLCTVQTATSSPAMASPRRPLPTPPLSPPRNNWDGPYSNPALPGGFPDAYSYETSYMSPYPYPPNLSPTTTPDYEAPSATLRGGTLLHKGFYDLLALIPSIPNTPSPSRFFWPARSQSPENELIPGPRYEEIPGNGAQKSPAPLTSPVASPVPRNLKARRISKDMVSKPTGFMYVHSHMSHLNK